MVYTVCDRCGKQIKGVMLIKLQAGYGEPLRGIYADLCDACAKDLRRWMDEKPRAENQTKS